MAFNLYDEREGGFKVFAKITYGFEDGRLILRVDDKIIKKEEK
jgi:hypothetical protein